MLTPFWVLEGPQILDWSETLGRLYIRGANNNIVVITVAGELAEIYKHFMITSAYFENRH